MERPVVLCGLGRVGWRVLASLQAAGWTVSVVDLQADPNDPRLSGIRFIRGDCRSPQLLEQAGIASAHGVLIVTSVDLVNVSTALLVRRLNTTVRIVVRMFNQNLIARLGDAVRNTVALSVSALTAPYIALSAVTGDALAAFKIGDTSQQLVEVAVTADSPLLGERLAELATRRKLLVLAHTSVGGQPRLLNDVDGQDRVASGDRLVVSGNLQAVGPLIGSDEDALFTGVRWAGGLRRFARTARRTIAAVDMPVKLATITLFLTLFLSALVFRFGVGTSWADGFYQSVNVVATGAGLHGEGRPEWTKVFLGVLKIAGAALVAGFTALFTNYLLKARLGGVFEARRIPDGGHVVICGLGNIGFRCVEELVRLGCQVVAIEQVNDSPFAATVRRMGVPVIIGDATVNAVLKQARADSARAVIATTSDELANLEIALLVRELNANQRVVVRLSDPDFAQAAREAADIKLAVSPPALAASAFAAALYGDRIQALAAIEGRSLAVIDLVPAADDKAFLERSLLELMTDYKFLPLGVNGQPPFSETGVPRDHRLKPGDCLTVALELADLERVLRRASAS